MFGTSVSPYAAMIPREQTVLTAYYTQFSGREITFSPSISITDAIIEIIFRTIFKK